MCSQWKLNSTGETIIIYVSVPDLKRPLDQVLLKAVFKRHTHTQRQSIHRFECGSHERPGTVRMVGQLLLTVMIGHRITGQYGDTISLLLNVTWFPPPVHKYSLQYKISPGHETRYFTLQNKWAKGWGDLHIIVARYVGQLGGILLSSSYLAVAVGGSRRGKPVSGVRDVDGGTSSCTEDVLEVGPRPRPRSWLPSLRTGHMAPGSWSSTMVGELGSRSFVSTIVLTPSSLSVWILIWIRALGSMTFADRHYCCNL